MTSFLNWLLRQFTSTTPKPHCDVCMGSHLVGAHPGGPIRLPR